MTHAAGEFVIHLMRVEDQSWVQNPQPMGLTADIASSPGSLEAQLGVRIDKRVRFSTALSALSLDHDQPQALRPARQVDKHGRFALDLTSLTTALASRAEMPRFAFERTARGFCYGWHMPEFNRMFSSNPRWTDRPAEQYESDDPDAMHRQVRHATDAGIDGFVCAGFGRVVAVTCILDRGILHVPGCRRNRRLPASDRLRPHGRRLRGAHAAMPTALAFLHTHDLWRAPRVLEDCHKARRRRVQLIESLSLDTARGPLGSQRRRPQPYCGRHGLRLGTV